MNTMLYSQGLLLTSGIAALCLHRLNRLSNVIGAFGAVVAGIFGIGTLFVVFYDPSAAALNVAWAVPYGSFSIAIDALGALFLIPIFILSAISALYGKEYLKHYYGKKNIGSAWFFFNLLIASMVFVVTARNAILFLLAWELMAISSFFLVLFEGEKKEVAKAGLIYLIATHIGTLFLLAMFILLGNNYGSFDFAEWKTPLTGFLPSLIFIFAVIGFGTKAGLIPMHIWLPEAHPAAPSHVSAIMSGVMIKTGVYGLIRTITFLKVPCAWWGYSLIAIGIVSGIGGILFALVQHDLKRLLAYSSIENIGIITMGIGLGVLGISINNPLLIILGFSGGLLHVINHAFFKGLLFLGAGVVAQETGTRSIDVLGGLLKKMPITGLSFLVGAAAICGLPPLNGFISEFLIYFVSFKNIFGSPAIVFVSVSVITALSLIGGLALACFTKVFGIIFLGEPRSEYGQKAHEPGILIRVPLLILAVLCVGIGLGSTFVLPFFDRILVDITGAPLEGIRSQLYEATYPLAYIVTISLCFYGILCFVILWRRHLLKCKIVERGPTWDCGYARPDPRMQYTASSFVQPIVDFFKGILRTQKYGSDLTEYFPDSSSFRTTTADMVEETVSRPLIQFTQRVTEKFTWFQHGRLQGYILYIFLTLVILLIWKL
jgi:hydrogenase-4 component B